MKEKGAHKKQKKARTFPVLIAILILLAGAAFALRFTGVLGNFADVQNAEKIVAGMFDALKNLDFDEARSYVDVEALQAPSDPGSLDDAGDLGRPEMYMHGLFGQLEFEVLSSEKADDGSILVNASISAVRLKPVIDVFISRAATFVFQDAFSPAPLNEKEMDAEMWAIFATCAKASDLPRESAEVAVKVVKQDNTWKVSPDDVLIKALFGDSSDVEDPATADAVLQEESARQGRSSDGQTAPADRPFLLSDAKKTSFSALFENCIKPDGTPYTVGASDDPLVYDLSALRLPLIIGQNAEGVSDTVSRLVFEQHEGEAYLVIQKNLCGSAEQFSTSLAQCYVLYHSPTAPGKYAVAFQSVQEAIFSGISPEFDGDGSAQYRIPLYHSAFEMHIDPADITRIIFKVNEEGAVYYFSVDGAQLH